LFYETGQEQEPAIVVLWRSVTTQGGATIFVGSARYIMQSGVNQTIAALGDLVRLLYQAAAGKI